MAKTKRRKNNKNQNQRVFGLILLSILSILAISTMGFVGEFSANLFRFFVGDFYRIGAVLLLIYAVYALITGKNPQFKNKTLWLGLGILSFVGLTFRHALIFHGDTITSRGIIETTFSAFVSDLTNGKVQNQLGGGMIGASLFGGSYFLFDQWGTYLILAFVSLTAVLMIFRVSYVEFFKRIQTDTQRLSASVSSISNVFSAPEKNKVRKTSLTRVTENEEKTKVKPTVHHHGEEITAASEQVTEIVKPVIQEMQTTTPSSKTENEKDEEVNIDFVAETENEDYSLPPIELLDEVKAVDQSGEHSIIEQNIEKLEETFESFGVDARVVRANLGPAVTKYEIQPATGVKVSRIVNLQNDIALALAAQDIRIEAPIPGRALIGIEVPNSEISYVSFREVIEKTQRNTKSLLNVPLGKDISGNIIQADLSKMPHLLIAGATGSGKSVAVNGIITSLLMRTKPNEVKLMMIDPKMVELNVYNGVPHLLTPVVTNPRKAARALNKVVQEMERRYELFASTGTRNRASYNDYVQKRNIEEGLSEPLLPFIVVIVDELADLMMVASKEVEDAIMRLAQMARAAGIHMILATQRPSVDVLTGTIKANIPSRIAFAVSSGTDSRTILDANGAEKLLGRGDMLYMPMGQNQSIRVQGSFISDQEVEEIVKFVKDEQEVKYVEEMIPEDESGGGIESEESDEYFEDAKSLVIEQQTASISYLQRRFRIGYNRAANLMDELEAKGIVGPPNGSKPREVLIEETPSLDEQDARPEN